MGSSDTWVEPPQFETGRARAWLATSGLAASVIAATIFTMNLLLQRFLFSGWESRIRARNVDAILFALEFFWAMVVQGVVYLLSGATFLVWVHRITKNAGVLGRMRLRTTPAMAVACWFIPVLNLFRPYTLMKTLYRASAPSAQHLAGDWIHRVPALFPVWWGAWLITSLLGRLSVQLALPGVAGADAFLWGQVFELPFTFLSALGAAAVLWSIQLRQEALARESITESVGSWAGVNERAHDDDDEPGEDNENDEDDSGGSSREFM